MLAHGFHGNGRDALQPSLRLVEEISHRVVNEYAEAIATLSMAAGRAEGPAQDALRAAADRLHHHADAHRSLLPPAGATTVSLTDHIGAICSAHTRANLADRNIRLILKADDVCVPADYGWRIGLIIAELIRNASRHRAKNTPGLIEVRIAGAGDHILCLVSDSGRSEPGSAPGRELRLISSLAAELGGVVRWSSTQRGKFAIAQFPAQDMRAARATATVSS